jgi:hypothetical protein
MPNAWYGVLDTIPIGIYCILPRLWQDSPCTPGDACIVVDAMPVNSGIPGCSATHSASASGVLCGTGVTYSVAHQTCISLFVMPAHMVTPWLHTPMTSVGC